FAGGAIFLVPRTFSTEPGMTIAFAAFATFVLVALAIVARQLPEEIRQVREGPTGRVFKIDVAEEAFQAGIGRGRPEGDRTVETVIAMLWFGLVEAGAWADKAEATSILAMRDDLQRGLLSFAELDERYRGGDVLLESFGREYRQVIVDFVTGPVFESWFEDVTQFGADPWALYERRRAELFEALRRRLPTR
ncbi:hypothetical protein, partial [Bradyrhizobium cenepequi]|uniref:hypothetical protein n=1 Tax=Bradyrhizobium cenepequi TaxID=2821403 RepID=UPI001CE32909